MIDPGVVRTLINNIKDKLTLDGKNRVFNEGKKLHSEFMKERAEAEAFTKEFLIERIFEGLGLEELHEKYFETTWGHRSADYRIKGKGRMFLVEAKPLNTDLFEKGKDGGVNQIKGLFKLGEVERNYDFGVATDGLRWVFIDKTGKLVDDLTLEKDFKKIKKFLVGEENVVSPRTEEEISKKFYSWYNALLHGGRYKDHKNKGKTISEEDCLVNNILGVRELREKEQIAQVIVDRLIFVKFLQSKGIIKDDILEGLSELSEEYLNAKLRLLFFAVFNTPIDERLSVGKTFKNLPYLNGSLFTRTEVEKRYPDYRIKVEILKNIIEFLDAFRFVHKESLENEALDPEILGYIFERAMTATDRKGTGAYYTPKSITRYISENTIYPYLLDRVNNFLKKEKGYKESELISDIGKIFILPSTTLEEIRDKILEELKVLDNACGSGAFLLSAANIIFDLSRKIDDKLNLKNSDASLKKRILVRNIYGVDLNPNAVEIAKLRLWLWLVDSYSADYVEPLPNIEYNLRVGNSLIGYVDLSKFKESKLTLNDYFENNEKSSLFHSLHNRGDLVSRYKNLRGDEAKEVKEKISEVDKQIKRLLDANLFNEIQGQKIKISEEEFRQLNSFHWGFEFYDVFDPEKSKEERGFDVVIGNPP
ncbi:MAG: hypothetical protein KAU03_01680, partial [Candidatus Altiarchaeales archaeon]|nr:hypothetical protein [Candidatus Altiarchaeales archaeon]